MKHFTFFPKDICIFNPIYICILVGTAFIPLIMYYIHTYIYIYLKIFEVYQTFLSLSHLFLFYTYIQKSIQVDCFFTIHMYACFLITFKIFFLNFLFLDIMSLGTHWVSKNSVTLNRSNEVFRKCILCAMCYK